jgi:hypothetical protein
VSPVQIVVVVRFVKLITAGVPIVTTTKLVGTPSQELPFKALIGTRLKRVDSDIVPVKE